MPQATDRDRMMKIEPVVLPLFQVDVARRQSRAGMMNTLE